MNPDARRVADVEDLLRALGIRAKNVGIFRRALTHASARVQGVEDDYEALEFLGDAVLGLIVADEVVRRMPNLGPGDYTQMRAAVVNQKTLAQVARRLQLGSYIHLGSGEEKMGGRERDSLLADCFEAFLGALYMDCGWRVARGFARRVLQPEWRALSSDTLPRVDAKTKLLHYCQARRWGTPVFTVRSAQGPDHRKEFEIEVLVRGNVLGVGRGTSKKNAEQAAAAEALNSLGVGAS